MFLEIIRLALVCGFCFSVAYSLLDKLPPHAGYHGAGAKPRNPFFEGWYLRVTTKEQGSIALIFHIFDPHTRKATTRTGVGLQVITPSGSFFAESSDISAFRGQPHHLEIRNYFPRSQDYFRLTASRASGRVNSGNPGATQVEFDFDIIPTVGWGGDGKARQYSTAGWLAAFPIFEPHYQVLISNGNASGSLLLRGGGVDKFYDLSGASIYLEKNWGGSFPSKWWWLQANTKFHGDLCVTATGAKRRLPLLQDEEEVALVALHWNGEFLPFPDVNWDVQWGRWTVAARYENYYVELEGTYEGKGIPVKCPTLSGMEDMAFETFHGLLRVKLFQNGKLVLDDMSDEACLEVGGTPWLSKTWTGKSEMKEPIKSVAMNVDLERRASDILELVGAFVEIPGL